MNGIDGKMFVGAPLSKQRFLHANKACADCMQAKQRFELTKDLITHVLQIGAAPVIVPGFCHVCGGKKVAVAVVEFKERGAK